MFKALGLDENAEPQKKVAALLTKQAEDNLALQTEITELKSTQGENVALTERIAELELRDKQRDIEVVLAKAVTDGQVYPFEKDDLAAVGEKIGVNELRSLIAKRPKNLAHNSGKEIGVGTKGHPTFEDPDTTAVARELGVDGDEFPVDDQSARLHAAAMSVLKEQGKHSGYTADEYAAACDEAMRAGV